MVCAGPQCFLFTLFLFTLLFNLPQIIYVHSETSSQSQSVKHQNVATPLNVWQISCPLTPNSTVN